MKQIAKPKEKIDVNNAYEGRDTLVISGSCIPFRNNNKKSCSQLLCDVAKDHLHIICNSRPTDISVAHRLSNRTPKKQEDGKPDVIVEFC